MNWIEATGAWPIGECLLAAKRRRTPAHGSPSSVAQIQFDFRQWDGRVGPWSEHFGKGRGQVHSLDGTEPLRSCQEVEVAKRLRSVRDHALWFSGYKPAGVPAIWMPWVGPFADAPDWLVGLDRSIRELIPSRQWDGMPDVVAWNDREPLSSAIFVECKGPREAFRDTQEDWVWAARRAGVGASQIVVSVRSF